MTTDSDTTGSATPEPEVRLRDWVAAHQAPSTEDAARARTVAVGQRPERMAKQSLVAVSHAIERAALAAAGDEPSVVIALFQRMEHFERERIVYGQLVEAGIRVAVGFCDESPHDVPEGVEVIALDPAEALVDEWSVVALSRSAGAYLVATDQHRFDQKLRNREMSRVFLTRWGFSHVQTGVELARIRLTLGYRLSAGTREFIDGLLAEAMPAGGGVAGSGGTQQELWSTTAAFHLAERMYRARAGSARLRAQLADAHGAVAARSAATVDPQSGLPTGDFLHRWSGRSGGETPLPVGLALFELDAVTRADDDRAAYHVARKISAALTQPLGPVDAAVRLGGRTFLVVVPGASEMHLARIADDVVEQLALASDGYPGIPLVGEVATVVTRQRPLPLNDLHQALERLTEHAGGDPVDAGSTVVGDRITVCRTGPDPGPDQGGGNPTSTTTRPPMPQPTSGPVSQRRAVRSLSPTGEQAG